MAAADRPAVSLAVALALFTATTPIVGRAGEPLRWDALPPLPDALGVAGPFVGIHSGAVIVAGGANFPVAPGEDRWSVPKRWHAAAWVLPDFRAPGATWRAATPLARPAAYGAVATVPQGVVCIGGEDGTAAFATVTLLSWDAARGGLVVRALPPLPRESACAGAAAIGGTVYVAGGQHGPTLGSAGASFLRLDMSTLDDGAAPPRWEPLPDVPGGPRSLPVVVARRGPGGAVIHVISGRRPRSGGPADAIEPLVDHHEFDPVRHATDPSRGWRARAPLPRPAMAGTGVAAGPERVAVLSGDDGALWERTAELRDAHPGFAPRAWAYEAAADRWEAWPAPPVNQLATPAVPLDDGCILVSGEVRPRHRSPAAWRVTIAADPSPAP